MDYNTREFVRAGFQSITILKTMNPELGEAWQPRAGEQVILVDHDDHELIGSVSIGERFDWVADIES